MQRSYGAMPTPRIESSVVVREESYFLHKSSFELFWQVTDDDQFIIDRAGWLRPRFA